MVNKLLEHIILHHHGGVTATEEAQGPIEFGLSAPDRVCL